MSIAMRDAGSGGAPISTRCPIQTSGGGGRSQKNPPRSSFAGMFNSLDLAFSPSSQCATWLFQFGAPCVALAPACACRPTVAVLALRSSQGYDATQGDHRVETELPPFQLALRGELRN